MKKIVLMAVMLMVLGMGTDALASYTFTYTGQDFTQVDGLNGVTNYYDNCLSGSFTLSSLPSNSTTVNVVTPTSYQFSDGERTLTNTTPGITSYFKIATTDGAILKWAIAVGTSEELTGSQRTNSSGVSVPVYQNYRMTSTEVQDMLDIQWYYYDIPGSPGTKVYLNPGPYNGFALNQNLPGQWVTTPIPAAFWLLGSGLIGLVGLRRRFKK
jgi:hypothetical protein